MERKVVVQIGTIYHFILINAVTKGGSEIRDCHYRVEMENILTLLVNYGIIIVRDFIDT
jgi:hypothetical protein